MDAGIRFNKRVSMSAHVHNISSSTIYICVFKLGLLFDFLRPFGPIIVVPIPSSFFD